MNNITERIGITIGQAEQIMEAYELGIETTIVVPLGEFHFFTRKVSKNKEIRCMTYHSSIFNFMLNDYELTTRLNKKKKEKANNAIIIKAKNIHLNESITIFVR